MLHVAHLLASLHYPRNVPMKEPHEGFMLAKQQQWRKTPFQTLKEYERNCEWLFPCSQVHLMAATVQLCASACQLQQVAADVKEADGRNHKNNSWWTICAACLEDDAPLPGKGGGGERAGTQTIRSRISEIGLPVWGHQQGQ